MKKITGEVFYVSRDDAEDGEVRLERIAATRGNGKVRRIHGTTIIIPRTIKNAKTPYFNKNTFVDEGSRFEISFSGKPGKILDSKVAEILELKDSQIHSIRYVGHNDREYS